MILKQYLTNTKFTVGLGEDNFDIDVFDGSSWVTCSHSVPTLGLGEIRDIFCKHPIEGSELRVVISGSNKQLELCEVEVHTLPSTGQCHTAHDSDYPYYNSGTIV